MDIANPHLTHSYSHEMIIKSALEMELRKIRIEHKPEDAWELIESYIKDRIEEITDRWKEWI